MAEVVRRPVTINEVRERAKEKVGEKISKQQKHPK